MIGCGVCREPVYPDGTRVVTSHRFDVPQELWPASAIGHVGDINDGRATGLAERAIEADEPGGIFLMHCALVITDQTRATWTDTLAGQVVHRCELFDPAAEAEAMLAHPATVGR